MRSSSKNLLAGLGIGAGLLVFAYVALGKSSGGLDVKPGDLIEASFKGPGGVTVSAKMHVDSVNADGSGVMATIDPKDDLALLMGPGSSINVPKANIARIVARG